MKFSTPVYGSGYLVLGLVLIGVFVKVFLDYRRKWPKSVGDSAATTAQPDHPRRRGERRVIAWRYSALSSVGGNSFGWAGLVVVIVAYALLYPLSDGTSSAQSLPMSTPRPPSSAHVCTPARRRNPPSNAATGPASPTGPNSPSAATSGGGRSPTAARECREEVSHPRPPTSNRSASSTTPRPQRGARLPPPPSTRWTANPPPSPTATASR
ncbi:MAG: hypothetical protein U0232_11650 [Thermomicrobiales bacterium]